MRQLCVAPTDNLLGIQCRKRTTLERGGGFEPLLQPWKGFRCKSDSVRRYTFGSVGSSGERGVSVPRKMAVGWVILTGPRLNSVSQAVTDATPSEKTEIVMEIGSGILVPYERGDVAVTGNNADNQHVTVGFDAIEDDVAAHRKAAQARKQILVTVAAHVRMTGEQKESLGESINEAVGNVHTAALGNDEIPDVVKVGFGFACNAVRHS